MEEDLQFIQQMAGLTFETSKKKIINKSRGEDTSSLTRKYFEKLDRKQLDGIYELFRIDFEMFGYNPKL